MEHGFLLDTSELSFAFRSKQVDDSPEARELGPYLSCLGSSLSTVVKRSLRSNGFLRKVIWRCCISSRAGELALTIRVGTVSNSLMECSWSASSRPLIPGS